MLADRVLAEWVLSENEKARFDALVLVGELRLIAALPALKELSRRCQTSGSPGAPHYLQWANRIIAKLDTNPQ
jgi:hypothetical protein